MIGVPKSAPPAMRIPQGLLRSLRSLTTTVCFFVILCSHSLDEKYKTRRNIFFHAIFLFYSLNKNFSVATFLGYQLDNKQRRKIKKKTKKRPSGNGRAGPTELRSEGTNGRPCVYELLKRKISWCCLGYREP